MSVTIHVGDALQVLRTLEAESVHCVISSPPYWGLRDYGTAKWEGGRAECRHRVGGQVQGTKAPGAITTGVRPGVDASRCLDCGARRIDAQLGLEPTPEEHVARMVEVFREVRRVLRKDGTAWVNYGDSYVAGQGGRQSACGELPTTHRSDRLEPSRRDDLPNPPASWAERSMTTRTYPPRSTGLKPKDLVGMPWRIAFALQADGWWLRSEIIWCLSGGARVYARTQKGDMPMMIKDLVRLDPSTVKLWNGEKWTQALGWSRSIDPRDTALEIEIRSGERIGCTPGHQWPTERGIVRACDLQIGDVILTTDLPQPEIATDASAFNLDVAWLCGLYLAEGSMSGNKVQIAGHADQSAERLERLERVAKAFHGSASVYTDGKSASIILSGPTIAAVIRAYIHGDSARDKGLKVRVWQRNEEFLRVFLEGYLAGDGHYDEANDRWRIGFTRNDRLAADFRTLAARLGLSLRLAACTVTGFGKEWPAYRGDIRLTRTTHRNARKNGEVVAIRPSRARKFWDIGVDDEPHLFALASGVLTHNSKPNPMPESVTDRPTKAHEQVFLLAKSPRYFYDADAVREEARDWGPRDRSETKLAAPTDGSAPDNWLTNGNRAEFGRNLRSVWTIATHPFPAAHFATFPPALVEPCVKAGTSEKGCCATCGAPWERQTETSYQNPGNRTTNGDRSLERRHETAGFPVRLEKSVATTGWSPTCDHAGDPCPCVVLDPFFGAGTVGLVADRLGRNCIGIELNETYAAMAEKRIRTDCPMFTEVVRK